MLHIRSFTFGVALAATIAWTPSAFAGDLSDMSLEELLTVEISSVAKKRQDAAEAPAAVYVITEEDIRRSGLATIPDLLRLAPGLEVGELDGSIQAVTIRGFNSRFSNKLLVLVDGRAIYNPAFSGVFWDHIPQTVEEIERIEIIRGPGASIWGANAVNGVINIITKHAVDTLGSRASVRADSEGGGLVSARQGFRIGRSTTLRLYGRGAVDPGLLRVDGSDVNDGWEVISAGFRVDSEPNQADAMTLQGDISSGSFDSTLSFGFPSVERSTDEEFVDVNILGRWTRRHASGVQSTLQSYIDRVERTEFGAELHRTNFDLDFSQTLSVFERHEVVWGVGYRLSVGEFEGVDPITVKRSGQNENLWSAFVQDEVNLLDDRFALTLGVKVEHNDFEGFETQPSIRAIWKDPKGWALWGAVSRAVRTPSTYERDVAVNFQVLAPFSPGNPSPLPLNIRVEGQENLESERLTAYELGWRARLPWNVSIDIASFYNDYDSALAYEPGAVTLVGFPFPTLAVLPLMQSNAATLSAVGAEAVVKTTISPRWRVELVASTIDLDTRAESEVPNSESISADSLSPQWQAGIRSHWDVTDAVDLDVAFKHVAELQNERVPAYGDLDVRLGWRPGTRFEVFLRGDNLLEEQRREFVWEGYPAPIGYVARKVEAGLSVRF